MNEQLHATAVLLPEKESLLAFEQVAEEVSEPV
jgi:hypothetical protein